MMNLLNTNINLRDYIDEIIRSFEEISSKKFMCLILMSSIKKLKLSKSTEIMYGLRNFIGNANKFS